MFPPFLLRGRGLFQSSVLAARFHKVATPQPLVSLPRLSCLCHFGSFCVVFLRLHSPRNPRRFFSSRPRVSLYTSVIQGHSLAPRGSIPYPGRHGYPGHLSQRVAADQTGVHPDDVARPAWLLGTFVRHNAQVLVAVGEETSRAATALSSLSVCVCACVHYCIFTFCGSSPLNVQLRGFTSPEAV